MPELTDEVAALLAGHIPSIDPDGLSTCEGFEGKCIWASTARSYQEAAADHARHLALLVTEAQNLAVVPVPQRLPRRSSDDGEGWQFPNGEVIVWDHQRDQVDFDFSDGQNMTATGAVEFAGALVAGAREARKYESEGS